MIGIYGNKQTMPESQKKELFSAGITYMVSGEYAFAFSCFTQAGKSDLPTLYNKALCYYYLSLYNDCRSLLLEAERLLPPLTERLPENLPKPSSAGNTKKALPVVPCRRMLPITSPPYNC